MPLPPGGQVITALHARTAQVGSSPEPAELARSGLDRGHRAKTVPTLVPIGYAHRVRGHDPRDLTLGRLAIERGILERTVAFEALERSTREGCGFLAAARSVG